MYLKTTDSRGVIVRFEKDPEKRTLRIVFKDRQYAVEIAEEAAVEFAAKIMEAVVDNIRTREEERE